MTTRTIAFATLAAAAALTFTLAGAAQLTKVTAASVAFRAKGPAGLNIDGSGSQLQVADDSKTLTVVVPLAALKTGIDLRDKHMREHLNAAQHPNAELRVARSALKFPESGASSSGQAQGEMKLNGTSRPVTFSYTAKRSGNQYDVTGSTQINIKDFGIKVPSYLGVTVKPDVSINVKFVVNDV